MNKKSTFLYQVTQESLCIKCKQLEICKGGCDNLKLGMVGDTETDI